MFNSSEAVMDVLLFWIQLLAVWVIVPLGLGLVDDLPGGRVLRWCQRPAAALATIALVLPQGPVAAAFAGGYGVWCLAAAGAGAVLIGRALRRSGTGGDPADVAGQGAAGGRLAAAGRWAVGVAPAAALLSLPVAALGMVASTGGRELFGFKLILLTLTSVHFHFAGFGAVLIAGRTAQALDRRWTDLACVAVVVSPAIIGAMFFVSPAAQLPAVVTLSVGVALLALAHLCTRPGVLLTVSGLSVLVPMVLAVWWTAGLAFDVPHLTMTWTAATHGVANALGYTLCGLLGWRQLAAYQADGYSGAPTSSGEYAGSRTSWK